MMLRPDRGILEAWKPNRMWRHHIPTTAHHLYADCVFLSILRSVLVLMRFDAF
jgi:hypothetical protein